MESSPESYAGEDTRKGAPDGRVSEKGNLKKATVGFRGDCGSRNWASRDLLWTDTFNCNSLRGSMDWISRGSPWVARLCVKGAPGRSLHFHARRRQHTPQWHPACPTGKEQGRNHTARCFAVCLCPGSNCSYASRGATCLLKKVTRIHHEHLCNNHPPHSRWVCVREIMQIAVPLEIHF